MPTEQEIESRFWNSLRSDRTVMLGLSADDVRPMTALMEEDEGRGALWIFTANDTGLVQHLTAPASAFATFASKSHDLFALINGSLVIDMNRAMIDKLWNPYVAAWYEHGKDDPKLVLLRFDPHQAEIWLDETSLITGFKLLLGLDPKIDYQDKIAKVNLD